MHYLHQRIEHLYTGLFVGLTSQDVPKVLGLFVLTRILEKVEIYCLIVITVGNCRVLVELCYLFTNRSVMGVV